jgi:hypothetical protein
MMNKIYRISLYIKAGTVIGMDFEYVRQRDKDQIFVRRHTAEYTGSPVQTWVLVQFER